MLWARSQVCSKWRRLPRGTPAPKGRWTCAANTDLTHNTCYVEEETEGAVAVNDNDEWIQCDVSSCAKWRRLLPGASVPKGAWVCAMNADLARAACEADEEV